MEQLKIDRVNLPDGFIEALCSLICTSHSLKYVSLPRYEMKWLELEPFYASLAQNYSLGELCINTSYLLNVAFQVLVHYSKMCLELSKGILDNAPCT